MIPHKLRRKLMGLRRWMYGLRVYVPWVRERHILEIMVGPLGYWDQLQRYQFNVLTSNGLLPSHKLLDIGCGPLQGGISFINYLNCGNYFGVDLQNDRIEAGQRQIKKYNLSEKMPNICVSDSFGNKEFGQQKFDYFWLSQILYYFDSDTIKALLKDFSLRMAPGGVLIGDILGPGHYEHSAPEYDWQLHSVQSIRQIAEPLGFKVELLGELVDYGYPKRLSLKSNNLLKITRSDTR